MRQEGEGPSRRRAGHARAVLVLAEIVPLLLILSSIVVTLGLIVRLHRIAVPPPAPLPVAVVEPPAPAPPSPPPPPKPPTPVAVVEPQAPPPPPRDPTPLHVAARDVRSLAGLAAAERIKSLAPWIGAAREAIVATAQREATKQAALRYEAQTAAQDAARINRESITTRREIELIRERIERERQERAKAEVDARSGYAILPFKGPNGSWLKPIPIECVNGKAVLQPDGPELSLLELDSRLTRMSPLAVAVSRRVRASETSTSDGSPSAPYVLFVVRPDGIRAFYEARSQLEEIGVAYGYELVDQDWDIRFPPGHDSPSTSDSAKDRDALHVWRAGESGPSATVGLRGGVGGSGAGWPAAIEGLGGEPAPLPLAGLPRAETARGSALPGSPNRPGGGRPAVHGGQSPAAAPNAPKSGLASTPIGASGAGSGSLASPRRLPLTFVVTCTSQGISIHPGGIRLSANSLKTEGPSWIEHLRQRVETSSLEQPGAIVEPRIRFLIRKGGEPVYWTAKSQALLAGLEWPIDFQVADADGLGIFRSKGTTR